MSPALSASAVALLASLALTPGVRRFATERGLFDHAISARKIHGRPIPRLGGAAIVLAFLVAFVAFVLVDAGLVALAVREHHFLIAVVGGGLLITALGIWDDVSGLGAKQKLLVQFGVAGLAWAAGARVDVLSLPLLGTVELGALGLPLTLLWIAGVTNAFNLIDGLDGLAGGIALIGLGALFTLAVLSGDTLMAVLVAALAGAVLGFLVFNFHPASIFMGDSGSMFLGYVLAVLSIRAAAPGPGGAVALLAPALALGVPIGDTLLAICRRAVRGVPLFSADRGHIHHRLLERGLTQRQASLVLYGAAACLGGTGLVLTRATDAEALAALAFIGAGAVLALRRIGFLRWRQLPVVLAERRNRLRAVANELPVVLTVEAPEPALESPLERRIAG